MVFDAITDKRREIMKVVDIEPPSPQKGGNWITLPWS